MSTATMQNDTHESLRKRHPLAAYFVLAFLITWLGVLPLVLSAQGLIAISVPPAWHAAGALGPIVAALIVTAATRGRQGVDELFSRVLRWRVGLGWVALTVLSPLVLFAVSAIILRLFGMPWPDFSRLPAAFSDATWVVGLIVSSVFYGFGEEPGWRGFALPRLQKSHSALLATLILTAFWALWHLPFFFYKFDFQGAPTIFGFFLSMFAGALWLTFLYNSTGGSILMVSLWHFIWNVLNVAGPIVLPEVAMPMNMLMIVVGVAVLLIGGVANLSRSGKHTLDI